MTPKPHTEWTDELVAALGTMSDAQLVERFGLAIQPSAVAAQRIKRGIPNVPYATKKVEWEPEWLEMLGVATDAEVAKVAGIHKDTVGAKRRSLGLTQNPQRNPKTHRM
jgi:hypothetical protein